MKIRSQVRLTTMLLLRLLIPLTFLRRLGQELRSACITGSCSRCLSLSMEEKTNVPPCTYEQLYNAYHISTNANESNNKGQTEHLSSTACWKLRDEILRVDANSILDRDNMLRLGGGKMGVVYRATLDLPRMSGQCTVAIKSDVCTTEASVNMSNESVSCLHRNAYFMSNSSTMGAEDAAALVYHSARQAYARSKYRTTLVPKVLEGIIPIWGIAEDTSRLLPSRKPRHRLARTPLVSEPAVRGVVMPFSEGFVPVTSLSSSSMAKFASPGAASVAQALLPAARSLAFIEEMGGALGDVLMKNVGIAFEANKEKVPIASSAHVVLFDYSKFTLIEGAWGRRCKRFPHRACNFCVNDTSFPVSRPGQKPDYFQYESSNVTISMKDFVGFKGIAQQLLKHCTPNDDRKIFLRGISLAENMNAVIELLESFDGDYSSSIV